MSGHGVWGTSVSSAQFCSEPKTALENKVYFFKKREAGRKARSVPKWEE